jgi:hypothetical protein
LSKPHKSTNPLSADYSRLMGVWLSGMWYDMSDEEDEEYLTMEDARYDLKRDMWRWNQ